MTIPPSSPYIYVLDCNTCGKSVEASFTLFYMNELSCGYCRDIMKVTLLNLPGRYYLAVEPWREK